MRACCSLTETSASKNQMRCHFVSPTSGHSQSNDMADTAYEFTNNSGFYKRTNSEPLKIDGLVQTSGVAPLNHSTRT